MNKTISQKMMLVKIQSRKIRIQNSPLSIKDTESFMKRLPTKNIIRPDGFIRMFTND
jgi:hypothetical protein